MQYIYVFEEKRHLLFKLYHNKDIKNHIIESTMISKHYNTKSMVNIRYNTLRKNFCDSTV